MTGRGRAVAAMCACGLVVLLLHETGAQLPAPPLGSWAEAVRWHEQLGTASAVIAALRLAAMAIATWLGLVIGLQALASTRPDDGWARAASAVSPPWLRVLAHGMAGVSLSAGLAVPTAAHADPPPVQQQPADEGTAVMRPLPEPSTTTTTSSTLAPVPPTPPPMPPVTSVAPAPVPHVTPETIVVAPGDSCWSIAADALADHVGHAVDDRIVARYWRRVLDANRDNFLVHGDPDLIFPGQELLLPPP